jgi:hypothetical protein
MTYSRLDLLSPVGIRNRTTLNFDGQLQIAFAQVTLGIDAWRAGGNFECRQTVPASRT